MPTDDYIWRVEYPDGTGPYRAQPWGYFDDDAPFGNYEMTSENLKRMPMPFNDGIHISPFALSMGLDTRRFGFDTLDQGRRWFYEPRDGDHFAAVGLTLAAYPRQKVRDLEVGGHQAVFDPAGVKPLHFDIRCLWSDRDVSLFEPPSLAQSLPYDA